MRSGEKLGASPYNTCNLREEAGHLKMTKVSKNPTKYGQDSVTAFDYSKH